MAAGCKASEKFIQLQKMANGVANYFCFTTQPLNCTYYETLVLNERAVFNCSACDRPAFVGSSDLLCFQSCDGKLQINISTTKQACSQCTSSQMLLLPLVIYELMLPFTC